MSMLKLDMFIMFVAIFFNKSKNKFSNWSHLQNQQFEPNLGSNTGGVGTREQNCMTLCSVCFSHHSSKDS